MSLPRRDFMKSLGISIGSILLAGCAQPTNPGDPQPNPQVSSTHESFTNPTNAGSAAAEPYPTSTTLFPQETATQITEASTDTPTTTEAYPFNDPAKSPRARLRHCWFYLSWLARRYEQDTAEGEWACDLLINSHRSALVELIIAGKMSESIARDVQRGFDSAVSHVHNSTMPIVCYD